MSSKGQIVLPRGIREGLQLEEGSVLAAIEKDGLLVLKKVENPILEKDLGTLKILEEAWKEIDEGKFKRMERDDFLKEIKEW